MSHTETKETPTKDSILAYIDTLSDTPKEYLRRYFSNAPDWLYESIQITTIKKNAVILREDTPVDSVYILVDGIIRAVDYRFLGSSYDYMWFYPVKSLGSMEILLDLNQYQTTLSAMTQCTIFIISKGIFEKWLKNDIHALSMETKMMGSYLLEEAKRERVYLFMQGSDRVLYTLSQVYEQTTNSGICTIKLSHQDLSDCTGLSIKTINRSLKKLENENYISRLGNKIVINEEQHEQMKDFISMTLGAN